MSAFPLKKRLALPMLAVAVVIALVLSPAFAATSGSQIKEESKTASTQTRTQKASVETPNPASKARMAAPSASGEPTRWLYEGIDVSGLGSNPLDHLTGADNLDTTPQLWVNAQVTLEAADQAVAPFTFLCAGLDDPAPAATDFNSAPASVALALPNPATDSTDYPLAVYARADADCVFNESTPEEVSLTRGQVLRLPAVYLDTTAPEQNGTAQVDGGRFFDGVLYATDIELTIPAHDVAPVGVTGADTADVMSGLAEAVLSYNGTELDTVRLNAEDTPKNEEDFVFALSAPASYDVDKLTVEFFDKAGNRTSAPVADMEDASGTALTGGKIVLTDTEPTVSVAYEAHEAITSDFYGERTVVVTVHDAHLDALLGWYASLSAADKQAVAPVITLENTLLGASDPARLMSVSLDQLTQPSLDSSYGEARVPVVTSGRYRVVGAEGVPSYAGIVPGVGSTWASDANLAPFVVDADAPTAGAVTIDPTQMIFFGSLYSMSDVTVAFDLQDKESGIDPHSVVLTMDGTSQRLEFKASDDGRSGRAQWNVTAPQVDLSKVALTFKDKMGHESSIPNLKEYSQKNIDVSFIYAFVAKPTLSLAFDNDDVRNGKYFNEARTATVTLEDPHVCGCQTA